MFQRKYIVVAICVWLVMFAWLMFSGRVMFVSETAGRPYDPEMVYLAIGKFPITFLRSLSEEFVFRFFPVFVILGTTYCAFHPDLSGNVWIELRPGASKSALYVRLIIYGIFATFVFAIGHRGTFMEVLTLQGAIGLLMYIAFLLAVGGKFEHKSLVRSMVAISIAHALYNTTVDALAGARIIL